MYPGGGGFVNRKLENAAAKKSRVVGWYTRRAVRDGCRNVNIVQSIPRKVEIVYEGRTIDYGSEH